MLFRLFFTMVTLVSTMAFAQDNSAKLTPAKCGSVKQLHAFKDIYLAGQPSVADFREFKQRGVKAVLNLRTKEELDFDEAKVLKELGLEYHHVPIASPDALTDDNFDKLRKLLNEKEQRPLLLHCASANRVGAVWLAFTVRPSSATTATTVPSIGAVMVA